MGRVSGTEPSDERKSDQVSLLAYDETLSPYGTAGSGYLGVAKKSTIAVRINAAPKSKGMSTRRNMHPEGSFA